MIKVKKVTQTNASYQIQLGDDETFEFDLIFDRDEWVLQGEDKVLNANGSRGIRYSQAELSAILKVIKEMNSKL